MREREESRITLGFLASETGGFLSPETGKAGGAGVGAKMVNSVSVH